MTDLIGPAAVVALGMFDGMHIGHQALIIRTVAVAKEEGCVSAVQTFSNHPGEVLGGRVSLLSGPSSRSTISL